MTHSDPLPCRILIHQHLIRLPVPVLRVGGVEDTRGLPDTGDEIGAACERRERASACVRRGVVRRSRRVRGGGDVQLRTVIRQRFRNEQVILGECSAEVLEASAGRGGFPSWEGGFCDLGGGAR